MFEYAQTTHVYDTRNRYVTNIPIPKTHSASKAIRYAVPLKIKQTQSNITDKIYTHSISGFCQYVKKCLIERYKQTCEIWNCYVCNKH